MAHKGAAVRCMDCGFVEIWTSPTGPARELTLHERAELCTQGRANRTITCFRRVADLNTEALKHAEPIDAGGVDYGSAAYKALNTARRCEYWFRHVPGFNAEQHLYLREASQAEERSRRWNLASALLGAIVGGVLTGAFTMAGVLLALACG